MVESDTSRHPIKMHYKQLPAIRLNYWKFRGPVVSSRPCSVTFCHIVTVFQAVDLKLGTNKLQVNMRSVIIQTTTLFHIFFLSLDLYSLPLQSGPRKSIVISIVRLTQCNTYTQPRWRCKMHIISITNLVIFRRQHTHTCTIAYNVARRQNGCLLLTQLNWIFYWNLLSMPIIHFIALQMHVLILIIWLKYWNACK